MHQHQHTLSLTTQGPGLYDITDPVSDWVQQADIADGLLTLLIQHTSASLLIQENADPDVLADLQDAFARLAPHAGPYRHATEGPDDMPAHIRAALSQSSLSIPVAEGRLRLGTWQGIYVFEHRDQPHRRQIALHLLGE